MDPEVRVVFCFSVRIKVDT